MKFAFIVADPDGHENYVAAECGPGELTATIMTGVCKYFTALTKKVVRGELSILLERVNDLNRAITGASLGQDWTKVRQFMDELKDAVQKLGRMGGTKVVKPVVDALGDSAQGYESTRFVEAEALREAAIEALREIGPEAIPWTKKGTKDSRPAVRRAFTRALKACGGKSWPLMKLFHRTLESIKPSNRKGRQTERKQTDNIQWQSKIARTREVRVFISSTFRDMHEERDELVKKVFPQLRQLCAERGAGFTEVDLRWGVTEEEVERGEVLPICLAEIEKCRPYFICLLGERYGWVPEAIPGELVKDEPWLKEHLKKSITHLEILHGVLNNPEMADHAFFYFRDPGYLNSVPLKSRADFAPESPESKEKLDAAKQSIRNSCVSLREDYPDPEAVGQLVLKDLMEAIDKKYPEGPLLSPLDRERLDHEAFARSRTVVYIGREEYFQRLNAHVEGDGNPLVILGESGSGKSALLSNWALTCQEQNPDEHFLLHFIGSTSSSTDWASIVRRIMGDIKARYGLRNEIPEKLEDLRAKFPNWLSIAASQGRFILVLDALNQLEDRHSVPDLVWLPVFIPPEVRLIVSTLPGRSLEELEKRGWPEMDVHPLEVEEQKQLINRYLFELYRKKLPPEQVDQIVQKDGSPSNNPLFLHALLEELRIFGMHEKLPEKINHYLQARDPKELYMLILERLEADYEKSRPGLVRDSLTLLYAAKRGLSEEELLEIMDMPRLSWSPLYLAMSESLVSHSGLLGFFHAFLREAVRDRYLHLPGQKKNAHLRLADYFGGHGLDERKIDELPWQLAEAGEWKRLKDCLADLPFFCASYRKDEFEVLEYWQRVEANSDFTCVEAYKDVIVEPCNFLDVLFPLSAMFYSRGNIDQAFSLRKAQENHYRSTGDIANLQACRGNLALILWQRGYLDEAIALLREKAITCEDSGDNDGLQQALGNLAAILGQKGELDESMSLLKEKDQICREMGNKDGLQTALGNQALIHKNRGEMKLAMHLFSEQELPCKEVGNKNGLRISLGNQAVLMKELGKLEDALALHKKEQHLCEELGNKHGLALSFGNQAVVFGLKEDYMGAMELHGRKAQICREMGSQHGLGISLYNQAEILSLVMKEYEQALPLAIEAFGILKRLNSPHVNRAQKLLSHIHKSIRGQGKEDV